MLPQPHEPSLPSSSIPSTTSSRSITPFNFAFDQSSLLATSPPIPTASLLLDPKDSMVITMDPFWGDKPGENAQDFLRAFNRAIGDKSNELKANQFPNYLRTDSEADDWWSDLSAAVQAKWEDIEAGFMVRWPRAVVVKKTSMEYEEELLGLMLRAQDLGRKEQVVGREVYTHIAWADNMRRLAKGAGVEAGLTYIGQV